MFKHLGMTLNKSKLHAQRNDEQLDLGNASYSMVQNFVFPSVMYTYKEENVHTIISILVLHGCETWSLPLREEHRM
jgi:hypothetical protein